MDMFNQASRTRHIFAFLPFLQTKENPHDNITKTVEELTNKSGLTGIERLKLIFQPQQNELIHPILVSIIQTSFASFFMGGIYGGIITSKSTFINFIENNQATQFRSHLEAKKMLSDKMFLSFVKGFAIWGTKIGFFSSSFIVAHTLISVYNDNHSFFNYTFGGMYAGALYKFPLGAKGIISGGFFGSIFGSLYGSLRHLLLKLTNRTEETLIQQHNEYKTHRDKAIQDAYRTIQVEEATNELLKALLE